MKASFLIVTLLTALAIAAPTGEEGAALEKRTTFHGVSSPLLTQPERHTTWQQIDSTEEG